MSDELQTVIEKAEWRRSRYAPRECKGIVYIVQFGSFYKIGHTSIELRKRIKQFAKVQMPFDFQPVFQCRCLNPEATEQAVHRELNEYRLKGEWFALDPAALQLAKFKILTWADCVDVDGWHFEPVMTGLSEAPWDSRSGYINELVGRLNCL